MTHRLAFLALTALGSVAFADDLTLRNGATFNGAVREQGDRVTIETEFGTMTFKRIDVRSIVKGRNVVDEFNERLLRATTVHDLVDLAGWATEKGMRTRADDLYRRVIAREPDQAEARRALGYEQVDGRWLQGDELQIARGLVNVDGRWLPKDVATGILERREAARIEADRADLAAKVADQRHEAEMARIALERDRLEMERRLYEQEMIRVALERQRIEEECRRSPWVTRRHVGAEPCPEPVRPIIVIQKPVPTSAPVRRPPQPQHYSPVPLTPPTVLPLTPPSPSPISRSTGAPAKEEKKEEEPKKR